ncbi:hypothetical protein [Desulfosporosinus acididurans]|uniref:hypothetical protein n=1 Tax=Desulfosporosinus acididurans TaxID=476652 RepID=UPI001A9A3DCB|nr:hypothetical protein [Desulfosporosinus acididurans]
MRRDDCRLKMSKGNVWSDREVFLQIWKNYSSQDIITEKHGNILDYEQGMFFDKQN